MTVTTSKGSYEVQFTDPDGVIGRTEGAYIVTDRNVASAWPQLLVGRKAFVAEPGESSKSMARMTDLLAWLANQGARRDSRVVAFGGGVIGDLAGFAAAVYMRGIKLHMVPTSLLAMVDSSVGGKVGVDLPEGKNLVGAFWPPESVSIAVGFLDTLPPSEHLCGAAEVWKYAFISDQSLLELLESRPLRPGDDRYASIVERCVHLKAQVVEADEFESTGTRAILNFGHTIGHAVEAALGYGTWTHGEAISVGMVAEAELGTRLGVTPEGVAKRVRSGLESQGLPTKMPPDLDQERLSRFISLDKKNTASGVAFSLLTGIGKCKLVRDVPQAEVDRVVQTA